jgi:hypothetical protein
MTDSSRLESDAPNMIQVLPWPQAIQAVKDSILFDSFAAFRTQMEDALPYNSALTRERYAQTIIKYFFPDASLDSLPRRAWESYRDDGLLEDLMRYQFLEQEPTVAQFVVDHLIQMAPGSVLSHEVREDFIQHVDPKGRRKMVQRLGKTIRRLGFVVRDRRQDVVAQLTPSKTGFLILLHYLFAPTPRIVTLNEILADPFWRYLGLREAEAIRRMLHEASACDLIARYATIDQLEQITTRYPLDQWFEGRLEL